MVALVTGAAKRLGQAIAVELAAAGYDLAIHVRRSTDSASETLSKIKTHGVHACMVSGELADPCSWPRIIEETLDNLGRLDVLVNNAAVFQTETPDTIEGFNEEVWAHMFRVNTIAPAGLVHHAREPLAQSGRGVVVNLCDIAANRPWPSHLAYCASKAALIALTQGLARSLAPRVRVNGIAPGIAEFPDNYSPQVRQELIAKVPLGRAGTPQEIARLVRFVVESADYMTGEILTLDGGRSLV